MSKMKALLGDVSYDEFIKESEMKRFDGYNRSDFHYARTAREAFGSEFESNEVSSKGEIVVIVISLVIAVYVLFFGM